MGLTAKTRRHIAFVGGPLCRASVKIRCVQIAKALQCDYFVEVCSPDEIPRSKTVLVCVKPSLDDGGLESLARGRSIVWDVHDFVPPREHVDWYLVSSTGGADYVRPFGKVHRIPHHHCNLCGPPNPADASRRPAWIGRPHWCPQIDAVEYDFYNTNVMTHRQVVLAYRRIGISLNLRAEKEEAPFHICINPGLKLINCFGFGIPSISSDEPAYHEYGPDCTIFAELEEAAYWVDRLQRDQQLYMRYRERALAKFQEYHVRRIAEQYRRFLGAI